MGRQALKFINAKKRCALAHGKLCFEVLKTFSGPENHLPQWAKIMLRSR